MQKIIGELDEKLNATNGMKQASERFKKLQTDQNRVQFALNILHETNIVPPVAGASKDAQKAEKFREEGNKIFVTNPIDGYKCIEALKLYTKSAAFAPYPSKQLALAYANRSAVLFKMKKYEECVQDIDKALELDYPNDLRAKLYVRKLDCSVALEKPSIEEDCNEAQYWLEKMMLHDANSAKLKVKLETVRNRPMKANKQQQKQRQSNLPLPTVSLPNPEVPCASNAVAIKYNKQYGRHVVATRKIYPGEIIAVEKPYSLILKMHQTYTHCANCLEVSWANIPCKYCTYAMYCSEECRDAEWKKFHDIECSVFPALIALDHLLLDLFSLRLAIQAVREAGSLEVLRKEIKEVEECNDPRTKGFASDGKLYSNLYRGIYGLETNTDKRTVHDLFRRSLDTSFILYYLATCTPFFGHKLDPDLEALAKNDDVTFIGGLILKHQQIIPTNMHSFGEEYGLEQVERGAAAMPFFSLINHSCNPNVVRHCRPEHMVLYALYPIEKDEQILDGYGEHYAMMPKSSRQQKLRKQYYFDCDCIPCREDWPLYYDLKSFHTLVTNNEDKAIINDALRKFNTYVDLATEGNVFDKPNMIQDLLKMIQVLHDHVPMPCYEMSNVVETLKRVYDLSGNRFEVPTI